MNGNNILLIVIIIVLIIVLSCSLTKSVENYRDPIWMNKTKLLRDYYPRANGSIYGTPYRRWDLLTGFPFYPTAI